MLTIDQQREQMQIREERKWDNSYKLPEDVEEYLKMTKKMLPPTLVVKPWTSMRAVSFFYEDEYLCSLPYDYIEDFMERIKTKDKWYTKIYNKIKKHRRTK